LDSRERESFLRQKKKPEKLKPRNGGGWWVGVGISANSNGRGVKGSGGTGGRTIRIQMGKVVRTTNRGKDKRKGTVIPRIRISKQSSRLKKPQRQGRRTLCKCSRGFSGSR